MEYTFSFGGKGILSLKRVEFKITAERESSRVWLHSIQKCLPKPGKKLFFIWTCDVSLIMHVIILIILSVSKMKIIINLKPRFGNYSEGLRLKV